MNAGRFALTAVALAAGCLGTSPAWSLGLGRLSVQSALGESLRAEIDVTSLTAEEASSLALRVASPEAYRAAGVEYNAALAGAQVTLQRRADGRPLLRVVSERPLVEPFIDVIVEATWATGRLVREYTLLLDPPTRLAAPPPAPSPAVAAAAPAPAPARHRSLPWHRPRSWLPRPRRRPWRRPVPRPAAAATADSVGDEYRVRRRHACRASRPARSARRVARPDAGVAVPRQPAGLYRRQHEPAEGRCRADGAQRRRGAQGQRQARRAT
jgi:pilus assembly protein FimV